MSSDSLADRLKARFLWIAGLVLLLWAVVLINLATDNALLRHGILPRTLSGLPGILFAPFLHGSAGHLALNTLPLLILGSLVILRGVGPFLSASALIIVLGGAGVWIFGRSAVHIGASGLIFGYLGYLMARGWYSRDFVSIIIAVIALILYGGMIWGVLPTERYVSWEAHLSGLGAGFLAGRLEAKSRKTENLSKLSN